MRNALLILMVATLLILAGACAGTSTGVGFYGGAEYYRPLYADPFWGPPFPPYYYPYGRGFRPYSYRRPFFYPPAFVAPYRAYPYRYGWYGPRRFYRR